VSKEEKIKAKKGLNFARSLKERKHVMSPITEGHKKKYSRESLATGRKKEEEDDICHET
jgi:hypothetical protein